MSADSAGSDGAAGRPLLASYDALLVDLDGVVHLGPEVVAAAPGALAAARTGGLHVVFVTNNAARTREEVAAGLTDLGVDAAPGDVLTSSMVAAATLRDRLPAGSAVLVVGGEGLRTPIADAGLRPVATAGDDPAAVAQGWSPEVGWPILAEACVVLRAGRPWVATNLDRTLPSPRGPLPGNGSLVSVLQVATGRSPESVGKPEPQMFLVAARQIAASRPLVVGDRLDTDIAGARAAGFASLAVLSGVSSARDLLDAAEQERPDHVGRDLAAVTRPAASPTLDGSTATCGAVTVAADGSVRGDVTAGDGLDGLRAACALAWAGHLPPSAYDGALAALGLGAD